MWWWRCALSDVSLEAVLKMVHIHMFLGPVWIGCKALPEPQGLVSASSGHGLAIGAHGSVEYTLLVPQHASNLGQGRVAPDGQHIIWLAMRGDQLTVSRRPEKTADLETRNERGGGGRTR